MAESDYSLNTNFSWKDIPSTGFGFGSEITGSDIFNNVFKGATASSFDWDKLPTNNYNWGAQSAPTRSDAPSWMDFGKAALDIASKWRGTTTSSSGTSYRPSEKQSISAPNAEITDLGSGYKMIRPAPKVTQKSSGGSSGAGGILGPVGSLVGAGIGAMVGGPAGASLGMGIGGAAGSATGSLFG